MPPLFTGPKLPANLLNQVDSRPKNHSAKRARNHAPPPGRKDRRKLERDQKKKAPSNTRRNHAQPSRGRAAPAPEEDDEDTLEDEEPTRPSPQVKSVAAPPKSILKTRKEDVEKKEKSREAIKEAQPVAKRPKERRLVEDDEIAALEKKLGIKGGKVPKSFNEDGLGDLLEGLDESDESGSETGNKRKRGDDNKWLESKRRKTALTNGAARAADNDNDDIEEDLEEGPSEGSGEDDSDGEDDFENDASGFDSDDDSPLDGLGSDVDLEEELEEGSKDPAPVKRQRENPYVAPKTNDAQPGPKYIPPSLRAASGDDAELAQRLRRQVQGLINRLSEANMLSILLEVEKFYQSNPRQYVTSTLIDLLLNLICDRTALNDTFIVLHAGFIAAVYKTLGQDFGAQMVERIVERFDACYDAGKADVESNKEVVNLVSLIAQLYNFQVIACDLVFDLVRDFLSSLTEAHTELLLRVVRSCGSQLRQDDPSSLKDIVLLLQKTVSQTAEGKLSVRTRFMIDTINDLKNNRLKAGVASSEVTAEHVARMRRSLGSLNARSSLRATEPLRFGLADIRDTEKKGKWWLIGASWKGTDGAKEAPVDDKLDVGITDAADEVEDEEDTLTTSSSDLALLARQNGMTTPIRKAIFITLLTSADYTDAHHRLVKLNLTRTQELEIPRVILHCVSKEQVYNPYYSLVAKELCHGNKKMGKAFGFAALGLFKRMGASGMYADEEDEAQDVGAGEDVEMGAVVQWAKFYAKLMATGCVGIGILKTLDLRYPPAKLQVFLEVLLVTLLTSSTPRTQPPTGKTSASGALDLGAIFSPAADHDGLSVGLRYFFKTVVAKTDLVTGEKQMRRLKEGLGLLIQGGVLA